MKLKRLSAGLITLALLLTLFAFPAAADNTYSVTLPAGATGPDTVAAGEDYTFTLAEDVLVVAYAEFPDGSICAAEAIPIIDNGTVTGYTRRIPSSHITNNFEIKTFTVETTGSGAFFAGGNGSSDSPFQIANELQLLQLMAASSASAGDPTAYDGSEMHYILTDDIEFHTPISCALAPASAGVSQMAAFVRSILGPGSHGNTGFFNGTFDGNGHTITGISIVNPVDPWISLIPTNNGTIKNLNITVSSIQVENEYSPVGGSDTYNPVRFSLLSGYNTGTIDKCNVAASTANIHIGVSTAGVKYTVYIGLVASINSGTITNCSASGQVVFDGNTKQNAYLGLLCGQNLGGDIESSSTSNGSSITCTSTSATNYIGGIAGQSQGDSTTSTAAIISKCENHASVTGTAKSTVYIGGIVGSMGVAKLNTTVEYCVNNGTVSTVSPGINNEYVGGIAGRINDSNSGTTLIKGCYNISNITSYGTTRHYAGGIAGDESVLLGGEVACFSYIEANLTLPAVCYSTKSKTKSNVYILANATDEGADPASEEVELSAADFKAASLVTTLNTALGENIFVAGTDYPVFSWLAAPASATDLTAAVSNSTGATPAASVNSAVVENGTAKLNVSGSKACAVIAFDGTNYTRMTAALNADGTSYDFTVPYAEGMTFTVAVKGDLDGDGVANLDDMAVIASANLSITHNFYEAMSDLNACLGDLDGDGIANLDDMAIIASANLSPDHPFYEAIEW